MVDSVKIFAGTSNKELAQKIAEKYGMELGKAEVVRFKDGEVFVKLMRPFEEEMFLSCNRHRNL